MEASSETFGFDLRTRSTNTDTYRIHTDNLEPVSPKAAKPEIQNRVHVICTYDEGSSCLGLCYLIYSPGELLKEPEIRYLRQQDGSSQPHSPIGIGVVQCSS